MITQLLQPPGHIVVSLVFADIVNEQGSNSAAVVGGSDSTVALLSSGIPDLGFDSLRINLD